MMAFNDKDKGARRAMHIPLLHDYSTQEKPNVDDDEKDTFVDEGMVIDQNEGKGHTYLAHLQKNEIFEDCYEDKAHWSSILDLKDPGIGFWDVYTTPLDHEDDIFFDLDNDDTSLGNDDDDDADCSSIYVSFNDMLSIQSDDEQENMEIIHQKVERTTTPKRTNKQIRRRMKRCAYTLASIIVAVTIVVIPIITCLSIRSQQHNSDGTKKEDEGHVTLDTLFCSAAIFVLLASSLSVYEICCHLTHWYMPDVQKYVVRILWMVPIYSVNAWCSIRFHHFISVVLEMIRGLYEAYVIAAFVYYLIELLGGEQHACDVFRQKDPSYGYHYIPDWLQTMFDQQADQDEELARLELEQPSSIIGSRGRIIIPRDEDSTSANISTRPWIKVHPLCHSIRDRYRTFRRCLLYKLQKTLKPWSMGEEFLFKAKCGVLQYVLLKVIATVAVVVMNLTGLYNSDHKSSKDRRGLLQALEHGRAMVTILENLSVGMALYCLVKIYYATKTDLTTPKNWHPAYKFLCVKGVVFFTFWQGIVLNLCNLFGWIPSWGQTVPPTEVTSCLQDYIVCVEMLLFAMAHRFTFSYREYLPPRRYRRRGNGRSRDKRRRRRRRLGLRPDEVHTHHDHSNYTPLGGKARDDDDGNQVEDKSQESVAKEGDSGTSVSTNTTSSWSFSFFPDLLSTPFQESKTAPRDTSSDFKKRSVSHSKKKRIRQSLLLRVDEEEEEEEDDDDEMASSQQSVGCNSCEGGDGGSSSFSVESTNHSVLSATSTASASPSTSEMQSMNLKQLHAPMSATRALWSSVVPEETLSDIRRFSHGTKPIVAVAMAARREKEQQQLSQNEEKDAKTQSCADISSFPQPEIRHLH